MESLSPTPPTTMTETWLISGDTEGIFLGGDEREFGVVFLSGVGVLEGGVVSEVTMVLSAPITTTSSFDIARLSKHKQ